MRPQPTQRRKQTLLLGAAALAAAALALAGIATANDGRHHDDDPAGTIASFDRDTGKLVIELGDGGRIAGKVTRFTWIDDGDHGCDDGDERRHLWGDDCRRQLHGDGDGWRHGPRGDVDDLVEGAVVEDALVVLKDGRAFYAKIELGDD
jgi:hypothetical protein